MKELVRHIEVLLLEHDCVIVPQVGGFVTCNVPARYIEEENLFLPPYRTVGFNEQLKTDDGLLVNSFAKTYRISEVDAKKILGVRIREMQQELWENGVCDLGSIGVLTMDDCNDIHFSPCQAGTVCPDYYGLDSLDFPRRSETVAESTPSFIPYETPVENKEKEITIRLKKTWLQNIAAVAAVVIMFFMFSPNAGNTALYSGKQAAFTSLMMMQPTTVTLPTESVKAEKQTSEPSAPAEENLSNVDREPASVESVQKETVEAVENYCVVVASAITEANAEAYVEKLHKNGYKEAQVYKNGKMIRVVFPGYKTEAEAHAKMNELSDCSEEFAHAWVYQIK